MKLQFWGVRGYMPTPGAEFVRYGGNTCSTLVRGAAGEMVVLDTGTGFCQLGRALMPEPLGRGEGELTLLFSHTHWDHMLGLPFPALVHLPGNHLHIYGPKGHYGSIAEVYNRLLAPAYSPVYGLENIGATQHFHAVSTEPFAFGQLTIAACPLADSESPSPVWGYRIAEGSQRLVYITDVDYSDERVVQRVVEFARGASVLIHSAAYRRQEIHHDSRHTVIEDAIEVALQAGVQIVYLFHHAPSRTDDELDELLAHYRAELQQRGATLHLHAAREGEEIEI
jgi:ribonuclease BN (tRNA processing enzyme)